MAATVTVKSPARQAVLAAPEWLEEHLHDPDVRVVEVDVSPAAYDAGHIDGAVLWNIYRDLKDAEYHSVGQAAIESLLTRSGISPTTTVVMYGYGPAMGFWLMKLYGHADVRILDCSRDAWREDGRSWSGAQPIPAPSHYPLGQEDRRLRANMSDVEHAMTTPGSTIVDVRAEAEFRGERFWPSGGLEAGGRAGHVPSAVHQPIDGLYDERGSFRAPDELARVFSATGDGDLITYCTIGGRASTAWFVLSYLLGRRGVRVYDGSWAEWGRTPGAAVDGPQ